MIQSVKIDGADLDYTSMNSFIDDVYKDHMAVHNYDSLGSILEDFGNVIGGAISDSLYGHYVSYYSDTSSAQTPTTEAGQSAATTPETNRKQRRKRLLQRHQQRRSIQRLPKSQITADHLMLTASLILSGQKL